jgi:hypothetical protein
VTPAAEALLLPSARLTDDERAAVDKLEKAIDEHVHKSMAYRGVDFTGKETNLNVLAEVNQRLKDAGYTLEWKYLVERHQLNAALTKMVGFQLVLGPSDEAYRAARL